jgi:Glyoxalase-like domain
MSLNNDESHHSDETEDEDAKVQSLLSEWEASKSRAQTKHSAKIPSGDDNSQSSDYYDLGPSVVRLDGDPDQNDKDDDDDEEYEEEIEEGEGHNDQEDDADMKALLDEWGGVSEDDDDEGDDVDQTGHQRGAQQHRDNEIPTSALEDCILDHIVLAAPDLDQAMDHFEKMTGVLPEECPSYKGLGTRCARVAFESAVAAATDEDTVSSAPPYLEIIAPDTNHPGLIGRLIAARGIPELTPFAFAIRYANIASLHRQVIKLKYVPDRITMFASAAAHSKSTGCSAAKTPTKFERLHLYGHTLGGICPFFIHSSYLSRATGSIVPWQR